MLGLIKKSSSGFRSGGVVVVAGVEDVAAELVVVAPSVVVKPGVVPVMVT